MPIYSATGRRDVPPSHPGELMHEALTEHLRMPIALAARRMGISRQTLHAILAGRAPVTVEVALRFSALAGGTPRLLLRMQQACDLWHAERRLRNELERIRTEAA